jgi:hypothetical protein
MKEVFGTELINDRKKYFERKEIQEKGLNFFKVSLIEDQFLKEIWFGCKKKIINNRYKYK